MQYFDFLIGALATWRVAAMFVRENGPYDVIARAEAGDFRPGEKVVCVLTGHGLKDPDTAIANSEPVRHLAADLAAVEDAIFG